MINPINPLLYQARTNPDSTAIQFGDESISYLKLLHLTKVFAQTIREKGAKASDIAFVSIRRPDLEIFITLALFHEGLTTCSNSQYKINLGEFKPDWIITDLDLPFSGLKGNIFVNQSFLESLKNVALQQKSPFDYKDPNSIVRLILTSGTTGQRKIVQLSHTCLQLRAMWYESQWQPYGNEICLFGLSTCNGFKSFYSKIIFGKTYYSPNYTQNNVSKFIKDYSIKQILGSPNQLVGFLETIDKRTLGKKNSINLIRSGGSKVTEKFIQNMLQITPNFMNQYGSSEAGSIAIFSRYENGKLINENGQLVNGSEAKLARPQNFEKDQGGILAIKTPYMFSGYLGDPVSTEKYMKNGWFISGDMANINQFGDIKLIARTTELINKNGVKIDPHIIDNALCKVPSVEDAATFTHINESGLVEIHAAIVLTNELTIDDVKKIINKELISSYQPSKIYKVKKIHRNPNGKIIRDEQLQLTSDAIQL